MENTREPVEYATVLIPVTPTMRERLNHLKRARERYEDLLDRAIRPLERKAEQRESAQESRRSAVS